MNKYLFLIVSLVITSCASKKEDSYTYFGGKIINPKSDYVLLYQTNKVIDSIKLTDKNTFSTKLKNIKPGLYFFKHGIEHQYVYLEPKDSILLRLNTWGFDESLVFSGNGAEKNNVLIETFLRNEQDNIHFTKNYQDNAASFLKKIDSLKAIKTQYLEDFSLYNPDTSDEFLTILNIALKYPVYTKLENFIRENNIKEHPEVLTDDFLKHRKDVDINKAPLMFYIPYRNYVYAHLYSDIYQKGLKKESDAFTIALLKNIHNKITTDKYRNRLLRHITIRHFYNNSTCQINDSVFNTYFSLTTNKKDKERIGKLLNDIKKIKPKTKLPSFSILNNKGATNSINELVKNKKSVIYFKGKTRSSDEWLASRVEYLMNKNKDTEFIIINVNENRDFNIKKLGIKNQFSLNKNSKAYDFLNSDFPRVILVNDKGIVTNSFAALSSKKIEQQITEL